MGTQATGHSSLGKALCTASTYSGTAFQREEAWERLPAVSIQGPCKHSEEGASRPLYPSRLFQPKPNPPTVALPADPWLLLLQGCDSGPLGIALGCLFMSFRTGEESVVPRG